MTTMRRAALLLATLAGLAGVVAPPASARNKNCPKRAGTVAVDKIGRLWHAKGGLYGCSTVYGKRPVARRLGPWTAHSRVAFDGEMAAWTVAGPQGDRVWAGEVDTGRRWMTGARAVAPTSSTPSAEGRVARIVQADQSVAWATSAGDVVWVMRNPASAPGTADDQPTTTAPVGPYLLVGHYPDAAAQVARSLALKEQEGEGDECGGTNPYSLTFRPGGAPAVALSWSGDWSSTSSVCY